ncbi:S-layer homology domain-containing protein [Paenibacillus sp. JSM ZJ436]|uniref:S-layer homology domain-containing protein n=1 Tax=Paenibacillus sp. JSM ZJ436 TaxID=3376190 RepID=UPI0037BA902B
MNVVLLKKSAALMLCIALLASLLPPPGLASAAAYYSDHERFDDFQNLDSSIAIGNHTANPPTTGQPINSSNNTARTLNNWRSNASAGIWSMASDDGSNVAMYFNGNGTSTAWLIDYSASDVLLSADVKLHPSTPDSVPSSPSYFGLGTRVTDNNSMYALAIRKMSASQYSLVLLKRVSGTSTELSQSAPIPGFVAGQYYRMTFQVTGTTGNTVLTGSIEGGPTVTALVTDSTGVPTGSSVGFFGNANMQMYADHVHVLKTFPGMPTGVTVISDVDNQVSLKWSGAVGAEQYHVKRGEAPGGPFTTIATVASGSYQDRTAMNGNTYYYAVSSVAKAMDGTNVDSSLSTAVQASPQASTEAPPALGPLYASIRDTEVGISWNEVPGAVGYSVKRSSTPGGPYTVLDAVYGVVTSYLDQGLTVQQDYYYTVTAFNQSGESTPSPEYHAVTAYPPEAPQGLTAIPGHSEIKLQWQPVPDAAHYTVKRASSAGGSYTVIEPNWTATEYVDGGLQNGQTYFYTVQAVSDNKSSSLDSNEASAMPQKRYTFTETQVTASHYDKVYNGDLNWGNKAANTLDDNPNTRWGANGAGAWIQYDLGSVATVGDVGIAFYKGDERSYFFDIQSSMDGVSWDTIYSGESRGMQLDMENFDVPDTDARYIRLVGQGNSSTEYNGYTVVHMYSPSDSGVDNDPILPALPPPTVSREVRPTKAGLYNVDGTPHPLPAPNAFTGRKIDVTAAPYGAKGDGITDDRPAIQRAIDDAQPGDEVFLPNGTYKLLSAYASDTQIVLKTGVNLTGESREGAILLSDFDNRLGPDLTNTGLSNASSRVLSAMNQNSIMISSLTITSTWDQEYPTDPAINHPLRGGYKHGIYIDKSSSGSSAKAPYNIVVDNVLIEKFEKTGVRMAKGQHLVVRNSIFRNATDIGGGGAGYGISLQGEFKLDRFGEEEDSQYNLIENNVFDGTNAMRHGIIVQAYTHNNLVQNNTLINNTYDAIDLHGEDEYLNEVKDNTIIGTRRGAGIALGNTGGGYPSNHSEAGPYNYIHSNLLKNNAEGITVVLGSPDTIIENNVIEIDPSAFVRGPYQQSVIGLRLLNAPRTIASGNTISNFEAGDIPILLDYDNGDSNAAQVGSGDPRDIQLIGNRIEKSAGGIEIRRGQGHVVSPDGLKLSNTSGNPVYRAVHYATGDAWSAQGEPYAAMFTFDLAEVTALDEASLQLSGRLTDLNPGSEEITLQVFGMNAATSGHPSAAAAGEGVYLGAFTMKGFKDQTYNLPYNVDSYSISTEALKQYLSSRDGGEAVLLVADTKGQGVPMELYASDHPHLQLRPLLKTGAAAPEGPASPEEGGEDPGPSVPPASGEFEGGAPAPVTPAPPQGNPVLVPPGNSMILPAKTALLNGRSIAQAQADSKAVEEAVQRAVNRRIAFKVDADAKTSGIQVSVDAAALRLAVEGGKAKELAVEGKDGSYLLPLTAALLQQLPSSGKLAVLISKDSATGDLAKAEGWKVTAAVDFKVYIVQQDGASVEMTSFPHYVSRTIVTDQQLDDRKTAVVRAERNPNGKLSYTPVPYQVQERGIILFSRSNSTYLILENDVTYTDIKRHWAQEEIEGMAARRIVLGVTEQEFRPDQPVTRAEFAALLTRTLGLSSASSNPGIAFRDVSTKHWYHDAVKAAAANGLVNGYRDGTFQPNQSITRQEMAVMIHRAMEFAGYDSIRDSSTAMIFSDRADIGSWATESVSLLAYMDMINGVGGNQFAPKGTATRAQSSAILHRMLSALTFTR